VEHSFIITDEYIELIKLLKASGRAQSGADAKAMVTEGTIRVDGEVETRKRRKVRAGSRVEGGDWSIVVLSSPEKQ